MTTINLWRYGKPHPRDEMIRLYLKLEDGKKVAVKCGLKDAVKAGPVNIEVRETKDRDYWNKNTRRNITEAWVKGFVGPTAREVGVEFFMQRVSINGDSLLSDFWTDSEFYLDAKNYLHSECKRLEKAGEAKARKEGTTIWSAFPGQFLIPDIGTVIQVMEDWTFRLFNESRNVRILECINKEATSRYGLEKLKGYEVTVKAGATLTVDRVYVRKGGDEFSSITFILHKGGQIEFEGNVLKAHGRFWSKLSDVNRMKVQVDIGTLSDN